MEEDLGGSLVLLGGLIRAVDSPCYNRDWCSFDGHDTLTRKEQHMIPWFCVVCEIWNLESFLLDFAFSFWGQDQQKNRQI